MLSCIVGIKNVNTFEYDKAKLKEWSNKGILKCPECSEKVIYCHGDFKIPYFKHEAKSDCVGSYYEPMTEEHIGGIKLLYDRLSSIDGVVNLEVEKYIKNTRQRPDIYFEYCNNRYCIEYQCSPISTQYKNRHELYELEGIKDIWILGTQKYEFLKYKISEDSIEFKEKKLKTIEDEIDSGICPLLYMDSTNIYKVNKNGFRPIIRDESKYFFKNSPLKTIASVVLNSYKIDNVDVDNMIIKDNKTVDEIISITGNTIKRCEKIVNDFNKKYNKRMQFDYNLTLDKFPMFQYWTNEYCREFYDIECKRICSDIENYTSSIRVEDSILLAEKDFNNHNENHILRHNSYYPNHYELYINDTIYNKTVYKSIRFEDEQGLNISINKLKCDIVDIKLKQSEKIIEDRNSMMKIEDVYEYIKKYGKYNIHQVLEAIKNSTCDYEELWGCVENFGRKDFLNDYKEVFEKSLNRAKLNKSSVFNKTTYEQYVIRRSRRNTSYGSKPVYKYEFPRFKKERFNNHIYFFNNYVKKRTFAPTIDYILFGDFIDYIYSLPERCDLYSEVCYSEYNESYEIYIDKYSFKISIKINKINNIEFVNGKNLDVKINCKPDKESLDKYINNEISSEIRRIRYGKL